MSAPTDYTAAAMRLRGLIERLRMEQDPTKRNEAITDSRARLSRVREAGLTLAYIANLHAQLERCNARIAELEAEIVRGGIRIDHKYTMTLLRRYQITLALRELKEPK